MRATRSSWLPRLVGRGHSGGTAPDSHRLPPLPLSAAGVRIGLRAQHSDAHKGVGHPELPGTRYAPRHVDPLRRATGHGVRGRDDACPGAVRLHEAADGFLARVRVPGGRLTAAQARALASGSRTPRRRRPGADRRGATSSCADSAPAPEPSWPPVLQAAGLLPSLDARAGPQRRRQPARRDCDGRGRLDVRALGRRASTRSSVPPRPHRPAGRFLIGLDDGRGDVASAAAATSTVVAGGDGARMAAPGRLDTPVAVPAAAAAAAGGAGSRGVPRGASRPRADAWRLPELPEAPRRMVAAARDAGVARRPRRGAAVDARADPRRRAVGEDRTDGPRCRRSCRLGRLTAEQGARWQRSPPSAAAACASPRGVASSSPTCRRPPRRPARRAGRGRARHARRVALGRGHRLRRRPGLRRSPWPTSGTTRRSPLAPTPPAAGGSPCTGRAASGAAATRARPHVEVVPDETATTSACPDRRTPPWTASTWPTRCRRHGAPRERTSGTAPRSTGGRSPPSAPRPT